MTPLQIKMNKLTDMDSGWWPFLGLRPKKEAVMNTRLLLKMTALFGSLSGALGLFISVDGAKTRPFRAGMKRRPP
jgi:hypothetical protein